MFFCPNKLSSHRCSCKILELQTRSVVTIRFLRHFVQTMVALVSSTILPRSDIQCKKTSPGQANTQAILHSRERTQGSPLKSAAAEQTVARSKSNKRERRFASPLAICDASSLRDPTKTRHSAGTTPTGSEHVPRYSFARRSGNLGGSQSQSLLISN